MARSVGEAVLQRDGVRLHRRQDRGNERKRGREQVLPEVTDRLNINSNSVAGNFELQGCLQGLEGGRGRAREVRPGPEGV